MIYLLGHKGFVGSAIARFLEKNGIVFHGIDRENYSVFVGKYCDLFINAGGSSKKRLATQDPVKDFELNVLSTMATLFDFRFKKYILLSSIDVYNNVSDPGSNTENIQIDPLKLSNYGFHKYLCELLVRKYCDDWIILRLGGMVGPGLKKNAIFDLITRKTLFVHPDSRYQYLLTDDVAAILWALKEKKNEIFNLCGKGTIVLEEVARNLGIKLSPEVYSNPKEVYDVNIAKVERLFPIKSSMQSVLEFAKSFRT